MTTAELLCYLRGFCEAKIRKTEPYTQDDWYQLLQILVEQTHPIVYTMGDNS